MKRRIIIPRALCIEVLQSLHSAHQGVTATNERAKTEVYWPKITQDIQKIQGNCLDCTCIPPSQARLPPVQPSIPRYMQLWVYPQLHSRLLLVMKGQYYLVAVDRLSARTEVFRIKLGTLESGSAGLCAALRKLFALFGCQMRSPVMVVQSSLHESFFNRQGVRHCISSSYLPSSNGRAEEAVKMDKRLMMDNVARDGSLDTDKMVRALLMLRNTQDPD